MSEKQIVYFDRADLRGLIEVLFATARVAQDKDGNIVLLPLSPRQDIAAARRAAEIALVALLIDRVNVVFTGQLDLPVPSDPSNPILNR